MVSALMQFEFIRFVDVGCALHCEAISRGRDKSIDWRWALSCGAATRRLLLQPAEQGIGSTCDGFPLPWQLAQILDERPKNLRGQTEIAHRDGESKRVEKV